MSIIESKTWSVGPYGESWVAIIHADTRGQARQKGARIDFSEYIEMRAVRVPEIDGKLITTQALIDAGFPETWEGEPISATFYILDCGCDVCKQSLCL